MKKSFLLICLLFLVLVLWGCSCDGGENTEYTVSFVTYTDTSIEKQTVFQGDKVIYPDVALERDGYTLVGWYCESKKWDFNKDTVTKDITLTAKWEKYLTYTSSANEGDNGVWVVGCDFDTENVIIPKEDSKRSVTGIHWGFTDRKKLKTVYIPSTVTYISKDSFKGCDSLTTVYCEAGEMPAGWENPFENMDVEIIFGVKK